MAKSNETTTIRLKLESLKPDATAYKAYSPTFLGKSSTGDVYVDIPVPSKDVSQAGVDVILTLDGLVAIGHQVIDRIHASHSEWNGG